MSVGAAKRILLTLVVAAILAGGSGWEDARAGSKWALVFLGDRVWSGDVRATSLGSDMQILEDSLSLQHNPATLPAIRKFTFTANVFFTSDRASSEDFTETDASFTFSSFSFAVPIMSRLTLGLGYKGRYDAAAAFFYEDDTEGGETFGQFYNRSGGMISFPFTAGIHIAKFLQVGGYVSVERGNYENRWDIIFQNPEYNSANSTQTWDMRGTGYGAGVVLRPPGGFSLGLMWESEIEYDTEVRERFTNPISNRTYTEQTLLPERLTVSGLWQFKKKFAFYGTWSYSDFTTFSGLAFPQNRLYTENIISGGFEYLRGFGLGGKRFPIRLGATFTQLPYSFPDEERIQSYMFEVGTGLKFRRGRGKLDLAIQGGTTGTLSTNTLENRVIRILIGVSGAEVWRRQRQTEF
jgi:hypothetical protein